MGKRINFHSGDLPSHVNPIPPAAMIGNILVTSAMSGQDAETGQYVADKGEQIALAFRHLRRVLELAGLTPDDVLRLTLYFADRNDRPIANKHWLEMFPDEHSRPSRLALISELPEGCVLQIDCMAVKT